MLNGFYTKQGFEVLKNDLKNEVFKYALIGSENKDDDFLDRILENINLDFETIKENIFLTDEISGVFFDDLGVLSFEISLKPIEKFLYAIALLNKDDVLIAFALSPKIYLTEGLESNVLIKIPISGEANTIIYKDSPYLTLNEFENFKNKGILKLFKEALPQLSIKVENDYIKTLELELLINQAKNDLNSLEKEQEQFNNIGKYDYFFSNVIPSNHVLLGKRYNALDYPLLFLKTLGLRNNHILDLSFKTPLPYMYAKGGNKAGENVLSSLPEISGSITVDRAHSLWGDGAFKGINPKDHFDVGRRWNTNNFYALEFKASYSSPIYGRSDEVEVNHNTYLEGIFAGEKTTSIDLNNEVSKLLEIFNQLEFIPLKAYEEKQNSSIPKDIKTLNLNEVFNYKSKAQNYYENYTNAINDINQYPFAYITEPLNYYDLEGEYIWEMVLYLNQKGIDYNNSLYDDYTKAINQINLLINETIPLQPKLKLINKTPLLKAISPNQQ